MIDFGFVVASFVPLILLWIVSSYVGSAPALTDRLVSSL